MNRSALDSQLSEWMMEAQQGSEESYENCLTTSEELMKRYLTPRLTDKSHLEDIVQIALIAVHRYRHTYDPNKPYLPWMYGITKRKLLTHLRDVYKKNKREYYDEAVLNTFIYNPQEDDGDTINLKRAINALKNNERDVIRLTKIQGYSVKETAGFLNISEANVKTQVHRAIKKLRKKLESDMG